MTQNLGDRVVLEGTNSHLIILMGMADNKSMSCHDDYNTFFVFVDYKRKSDDKTLNDSYN